MTEGQTVYAGNIEFIIEIVKDTTVLAVNPKTKDLHELAMSDISVGDENDTD